MLAAWHRLKYPHLSVGAIASGAPVDFYPNTGIQAVFEAAYIATFETAVKTCGDTLLRAIRTLEKSSSTDLRRAGVVTCGDSVSVESFTFYAKGAAATLATMNYPYETDFVAPLPANPVSVGCGLLLNEGRSDIERIVDLVNLYVNTTGGLSCFDTDSELVAHPNSHMLSSTEMGVTSW
eukprot:7715844-Pyramimonas_sp.AAC.1